MAHQFWPGLQSAGSSAGAGGLGWPPPHLSDSLDLGWVNEDTLATCLSLAFSHGAGPRSPKGSKRGQAPICNHFSTSDSVTFATVSLAEVRDVAQLGVGVEGDYSRVQRIMTILQTIPFRA